MQIGSYYKINVTNNGQRKIGNMHQAVTQFSVTETLGIFNQYQPIQLGVPLPRGRFYAHTNFLLLDKDKKLIPSTIRATSLWPDKSLKWILIRSELAMKAEETRDIDLVTTDLSHLAAPECSDLSTFINEKSDYLLIRTKHTVYKIYKADLFNIEIGKLRNEQLTINAPLTDSFKPNIAGSLFCDVYHPHSEATTFNSPKISYEIHTDGKGTPLFYDISMKGTHQNNELAVNISVKLVIQFNSDALSITSCIHNPQAAEHANGQWDLGDKNSIYVRNYGFNFKVIEENENWQFREKLSTPLTQLGSSDFSVYQESSAGKYWFSQAHVDKKNEVPLRFSGYEIIANGQTKRISDRASPIIQGNIGGLYAHFSISDFWQNFPIKLAKEGEDILLGLFPSEAPADIELQAGEKKTHDISISFSPEPSKSPNSSLACRLLPEWIQKTRVFPYFSVIDHKTPLQNIIDGGLSTNQGFKAKREQVDEYGWRNFGDTYADHETSGYNGDSIFVSHYNNQYDPLGGFLKQWLKSGELEWLELANDLAKHICDIDIYNTELDKPEYSGGLFWHTDHYVQAYTATHRTYSALQPTDAYQDHAGGGGPGGQHCYTTGLLYHHWLTGNDSSKRAVLQLTEWISNVYEGDGTLFSLLLQIKNAKRRDLKNILSNTYPLDRGTANYISALLDSYELTQESLYLETASHVIQRTISPEDDIGARHLENVEETWFYTVLLQAVIRFLHIQESFPQRPHSYFYARSALLHYAGWMAENEYNYLDKPEILEYPNETWTAQDLRKCYVLAVAALYCKPEKASLFKAKEKQLMDFIERRLSESPESQYTRVIALVMQNEYHTDESYFLDDLPSCTEQTQCTSDLIKKQSFPLTLFKTLRQFSLRRENRQLRKRFGKTIDTNGSKNSAES